MSVPEIARIDVNEVDGVWGWEAYTTGEIVPEDSGDIELCDLDPDDDETLLAGVENGLMTPRQRGCELVIHREGETPATYSWQPTFCAWTRSYRHRGCTCGSDGLWKKK